MRRPRLPRWLYPGMHIKRWMGATLLGLTIRPSSEVVLVA